MFQKVLTVGLIGSLQHRPGRGARRQFGRELHAEHNEWRQLLSC